MTRFIVTLIAASLISQSFAGQFLFIAANKDSNLISYSVDPESGALTEHARIELPGGGGPMSLSADGKFLYVESHIQKEGEKGALPHIVTLKQAKGKFEQAHVARVHLRSPGIHVDATGKNLLGAHYGEGKVSVWKIDSNRHCTGELTDDHTTGEKAHFITTDPSNRFAYVPHTGANAVYQFRLDAEAGKLIPLEPPFVAGPPEGNEDNQPRHYAHHPTLSMGFTSNERGGGISSWKFDEKTGVLSLQETLSTLPADWEGGSAAADIQITPNGRFVYVSNRDTRKLEKDAARGDTLAGFEIDLKTGKLKLIGQFPTVYFPRSFCIDTTGNFLFAAGQLGNQLAAYRIDQETGALERIGTYETGDNPIWVMCWGE